MMVINIIVWPTIATVLFISFVYSDYAVDRGPWYGFYSFCVITQIAFDILSLVILIQAFKRLKQVSFRIKMAVNNKVMSFLIASYGLFVVSEITYFFAMIMAD